MDKAEGLQIGDKIRVIKDRSGGRVVIWDPREVTGKVVAIFPAFFQVEVKEGYRVSFQRKDPTIKVEIIKRAIHWVTDEDLKQARKRRAG